DLEGIDRGGGICLSVAHVDQRIDEVEARVDAGLEVGGREVARFGLNRVQLMLRLRCGLGAVGLVRRSVGRGGIIRGLRDLRAVDYRGARTGVSPVAANEGAEEAGGKDAEQRDAERGRDEDDGAPPAGTCGR